MNFELHLSHAIAFLELDMIQDAWGELDKIDADEQERPEVLDLRVMILMKMSKWGEALEVAADLMESYPERENGFISAAFCLSRLGRPDAARRVFLNAPESLKGKALWFFNMACYECQLSNFTSAREYLERCFDLDNSYKEKARENKCLEKLLDV